MKKLICLIIAGVALSAMAAASPEAKPKQGVIPQAQPVVAWLKAVKTSDLDLLKTVWSKRMTSRIPKEKEEEHWKQTLKMYKDLWAKEFREYKITDFVFTFEGDDAKGKVVMEFKGKKLPGLRVIKEDKDWKVNEA